MVSKRGKRKRSSGEGTSQGEQKRKRASGETSVDSTTTGEDISAEQTETCEETSCADSQENRDLEQNPAVDSTESKSTLLSSQPSGSQPSDHGDRPLEESEICKGGDVIPAVEREDAVSAQVQNSDCHTSSTPGKNDAEMSSHKLEEEADQCDEESDTTLTNENVECNTTVEPVRDEEEQPKEPQGDKDKYIEENDKMKESSAGEVEDKIGISNSQEKIEALDSPSKTPDSQPLSSKDTILATKDSKIVEVTQDYSSQNVSGNDKNKDRNDEITKTGQELPEQSLSKKDSQTDMIANKKTHKENEDKKEGVENVQNGIKDSTTEDTFQADETTTETGNEQIQPTKSSFADALHMEDDIKPGESNQLVKQLISKTQLAQPNQAGDFLDTHALDKPSIISESSLEKEKGKETDLHHESDAQELLKKEGLLLEEKQVSIIDRKDKAGNIPSGKDFVEPFDLPNSQEVKERMVMTGQGDGSSSSSRMERD